MEPCERQSLSISFSLPIRRQQLLSSWMSTTVSLYTNCNPLKALVSAEWAKRRGGGGGAGDQQAFECSRPGLSSGPENTERWNSHSAKCFCYHCSNIVWQFHTMQCLDSIQLFRPKIGGEIMEYVIRSYIVWNCFVLYSMDCMDCM